MWPNPQFPADYVIFTEEILNGKLHILCSDIWRLRWVRDFKFGINFSSEKSINAAKYQVYSFYRFWAITEKPAGG